MELAAIDQNAEPLAPATVGEIETALKAIRAVMRLVEDHHRDNATTAFQSVIDSSADNLFFYLREGLRCVEEEERNWDRLGDESSA